MVENAYWWGVSNNVQFYFLSKLLLSQLYSKIEQFVLHRIDCRSMREKTEFFNFAKRWNQTNHKLTQPKEQKNRYHWIRTFNQQTYVLHSYHNNTLPVNAVFLEYDRMRTERVCCFSTIPENFQMNVLNRLNDGSFEDVFFLNVSVDSVLIAIKVVSLENND